jgi:hypothetical protein
MASKTSTAPTSGKSTLLQEYHRLTSTNGIDFITYFPAILAENDLWVPTTQVKNEDGSVTTTPAGPDPKLSTYTLIKNIVDKHLYLNALMPRMAGKNS